jgi:hypothetical protein
MVQLTDMKQIAYLSMKGIKFDRFERDGNKKVFYFNETQEEIDKIIAEYYNSDCSRFFNNYENIKTLVYRT